MTSKESYFSKLSRERNEAKAALQAEADANVTALQRQISSVRDAVAASVAEQDAKFEAEIAEQRAFTAKTESFELKGLLANLLKQPNRERVAALAAWIVRVDALSFDTTGQPLEPFFLLHALQVALVKYGEISGAARDAAFELFAAAKANQIPLAEAAWQRLEAAFARHTDAGHWEIEKANRVLSGALDTSGVRVIWTQVDSEKKAAEERRNAEEYARVMQARRDGAPEPEPRWSASDMAAKIRHQVLGF